MRGENFGGVAARRDLGPDFANDSVGADPERHAHDSQKRFPEEAFHSARIIRADDLKFSIREQREIQIVLGLEFRLRLHGISAASHDLPCSACSNCSIALVNSTASCVHPVVSAFG